MESPAPKITVGSNYKNNMYCFYMIPVKSFYFEVEGTETFTSKYFWGVLIMNY